MKALNSSTLIFFGKLTNYKIDCNDLVQQVDFYVPRRTVRDNMIFGCETARTNVFLKSPLDVICNLFNSICDNCNIATSTLNDIVEIDYHNLEDDIYIIQYTLYLIDIYVFGTFIYVYVTVYYLYV